MIEFSPGLFRGPRVNSIPVGIKTIIDLQYDSRDILMEQSAPYFFWEGTIAFLPPDPNRVKYTANLLCREDLKPIYIHCQSGVDRTGFVVASFRVMQGWSKWSAFKEMVKSGMHPWFYWWGLFL